MGSSSTGPRSLPERHPDARRATFPAHRRCGGRRGRKLEVAGAGSVASPDSMRLPALLLIVPLVLAPRAGRAETVRITVLHTTDVHGSLAAWDDLADRAASRGLE